MKLIIKSLLCIFTVVLINQCEKGEQKKSSNLQIEWLNCYGGSNYDDFSSIIYTSDGGYLVNGTTESKDGDVTVNNGLDDGWILKLDNQGSIEWEKSVGAEYSDYTTSIIQTSDKGFIASGWSFSSTCDVCDSEGWIFKLDQNGKIEREDFYGGSRKESFSEILQTEDGGYLVAGGTWSNDGDVTGNHGESDGWIIKMNENREIEWQKCYGGSQQDYLSSISKTVDGGYIAGGGTSSTDGDITGNHGGGDIWIVKLDKAGSIEWQKCYGGSGIEYFGTLIQTDDGGYAVAGESFSNDGDVSGNHGKDDYWIIKLDEHGNIGWQKCYGGSDGDGADCIIQTSDGEYMIVGGTLSIDGDVTDIHGNQDGWIIKLDNDGKLEWQECIGGTSWDRLVSIKQIGDNKYIIGGRTKSDDGDISGNHGGVDFVILTITLSSI
jgi:hypothetical protein